MSHYSRERKKRIEEIKSEIEKEDELEYSEYVGKKSVEYGLTQGKIESYLQNLEQSGIIMINEGVIHYAG